LENETITSIKGLDYNGELVGLRLFSSQGSFDIGKDVLKLRGMKHFTILTRINLSLHGELLLSEEEASSGVLSEDISENEVVLSRCLAVLQEPTYKEQLLGFQKPYELSLAEFMSDEGWKPERVTRTDEHRNQHTLTQPDGTSYRGGWIGSHRSLDAAKKGFHYDQVKYALHSGKTVASVAVEGYQDLKWAKGFIDHLSSTIGFSDGLVVVPVDNEEVSFPLESFPLTNRVSQRGFVSSNGLMSKNVEVINSQDSWFGLQEVTCISIEKAIVSYLKAQEGTQ
jgi:hypothetical protein